jgi:arginyl-tRNA synthetase
MQKTSNIITTFRDVVVGSTASISHSIYNVSLPEDVLEKIEVTLSKSTEHGDFASNAALIAAKHLNAKPRDVATNIANDLLRYAEYFQDIRPAGPGFVNITAAENYLRGQIPVILLAGESYGDCEIGQKIRVNVEYVSANPTGPMHIGHCRGAVVGDALANLLAKAGFAVTKEYLINDAGNQVTALAWAAYWRYLEAIGTKLTEEDYSAEVPGGMQYRGEYLIPVGQRLAAEHGATFATESLGVAAPEIWFDIVRETALEMMMASIREDLDLLGVVFDRYSSERALVLEGATDKTIDQLTAMGLIYTGTLEPPKGKLPDDWEPREQMLFRSTQFGDDVDRPLRKSDGSNTYFANDIAYHADKIARGAEIMIDVWGADHGGYVSRMQAAVKALSGNTRAHLDVVLCQIVKVLKGGELVRMSKRAGTFITLRDLLEEVGRDAVRFTMLTRKSDAQMDFDIDQAIAQTRENPVFYVQYAHARCRSVLRAAAEQGIDLSSESLAGAALDSLENAAEMSLIRRLSSWPRMVEQAAFSREPHRIAFFLYELAGDFHTLWNRGRDDATLRFLQPDQPEATLARIALVAATAIVIRSGMAVMGVAPVEEMR